MRDDEVVVQGVSVVAADDRVAFPIEGHRGELAVGRLAVNNGDDLGAAIGGCALGEFQNPSGVTEVADRWEPSGVDGDRREGFCANRCVERDDDDVGGSAVGVAA